MAAVTLSKQSSAEEPIATEPKGPEPGGGEIPEALLAGNFRGLVARFHAHG
jgi:hypothetical protein